MLDVLEKCLIRNHDGGVKSFLDLDSSYCFKVRLHSNIRGRHVDEQHSAEHWCGKVAQLLLNLRGDPF